MSSRLRRLAHVSAASIVRGLDLRYRLARACGVPSRLSEAQQAILQRMRDDNAAATEPFQATALWIEVAKLFDREFYSAGVSDVEAGYLNLRFFGYAPGDHRLYDYLLYTYYQLVKQRDSLGVLSRVPATCPIGPGLAMDIEGRRVSLDLLLSIDDFYNLVELAPRIVTAPVIVADLGAGWGRLGYVLKRVNPTLTYVVFDLPETLFVSSSYLPKQLPEVAFQTYERAREIPAITRDLLQRGSMWFLGAQDLQKVSDEALDVVVNVASFQEMTRAQVDRYFELIDTKARGGYLYLRQLWSGATHGHRLKEIEGHSEYPFRARWGEQFCRNSRFSHLFFEAGFRL